MIKSSIPGSKLHLRCNTFWNASNDFWRIPAVRPCSFTFKLLSFLAAVISAWCWEPSSYPVKPSLRPSDLPHGQLLPVHNPQSTHLVRLPFPNCIPSYLLPHALTGNPHETPTQRDITTDHLHVLHHALNRFPHSSTGTP